MSGFIFDNTYLSLPGKFYSIVKPLRIENPLYALLNRELLSIIGIDSNGTGEVLNILTGQFSDKHFRPFAQAYAGHQFGSFTILGDGRAIILGEHLTKENLRYDIQLKGAGQTPYSRRGDGKATLYAMLREYLISEAMHHLNISTSRSLAVIETGEIVIRETNHKGAVLVRLMKSHIRTGTFEFARYYGNEDDLRALLNYTIARLYPQLKESDNPALSLLEEVMQLQIKLVADWMRVGFIHGVMNTDNVSISGETFDYGPCAFINSYHPQKVFSSIDVAGRYSFANQPFINKWNLARLAEALLPLIDANTGKALSLAQESINCYDSLWEDYFYSVMLDKLGIENQTKDDRKLADQLLRLMEEFKLDYTNTFAALSHEIDALTKPLFNNPAMKNWISSWETRIGHNTGGSESAKRMMQRHNPVFIPRNHKVEIALNDACSGDYSSFNTLLDVLRSPYQYRNEFSSFLNEPGSEFENNYQTFCGT